MTQIKLVERTPIEADEREVEKQNWTGFVKVFSFNILHKFIKITRSLS